MDKKISVEGDLSGMNDRTRYIMRHPRWHGTVQAELRFVNAFWATFEDQGTRKSEPLDKLSLSWDDGPKRLKLLVRD